MRTYHQQIEDAYSISKRQGDLMRDREMERSSAQDRRNRYRDDLYQLPARHYAFNNNYHGEAGRTDRYGYEHSLLVNRERHADEELTQQRDQQSIRQSLENHRGKGPKNYTRSDERIREDIHDRLTEDPYVDASDIEIQVNVGNVMLEGTVADRTEKRRAEDIVYSVFGVLDIENKIKVKTISVRQEHPQND
jgi:osmotically-inducible protein OsmY